MNSILEYTMELSFLNFLLEKGLVSKPEYNSVKEKLLLDYRINTGVASSENTKV